jgi:hypothetical protein
LDNFTDSTPKCCFLGGSFMSQLSYTNYDYAYLYSDNTFPTFFGSKKDCFDMHTLRYRVFGAVWKLVGGKKIILGYWFTDNESELQSVMKRAGFTDLMNSNIGDINEVYQSIRFKQDQQNWSKRSKLPILSLLKKPWKNLEKGWYVVKSGANFPCILTCIQKNRYSIWIEHIQVCEHKSDEVKFIHLINAEHNIHLNGNGNADVFLKY